MKRPSREDSLAGGEMIPVFPSTREVKGVVYRRVGSFQSMLDGLGEEEEVMEGGDEDMCSQGVASGGAVGLGSAEKKRRLSVEQVKALEKNFEVENKLEPERKVKLAQELGLQPRQVAVWFQNRRARWKTKQLERDFGVLKANYDALKLNYDALHHDKEVLLAEIEELKAKLAADGDSSYCSIKEEPRTVEESLENTKKNEAEQGVVDDNGEEDEEEEDKEPPALIYKDGSSDSDSSAILNDENSPHHLGSAVISSSSGIPSHHHQLLEESHHHHQQQPLFTTLNYTSTFASSPAFQCSEGKSAGGRFGFLCSSFQPQLRAEERGFLGGDESCSAAFLSDEQLPWYCAADQWN